MSHRQQSGLQKVNHRSIAHHVITINGGAIGAPFGHLRCSDESPKIIISVGGNWVVPIDGRGYSCRSAISVSGNNIAYDGIVG
jgi:hypothetical protein